MAALFLNNNMTASIFCSMPTYTSETMAAASIISSIFAMCASIFSIFAWFASFFSCCLVLNFKTMLNGVVINLINRMWQYLRNRYARAPSTTVVKVEREDHRMQTNELYAAVETYLYSMKRPEIQRRLTVSRVAKEPNLIIRFDDFDQIVDSYQGIHLEWKLLSDDQKKETAARVGRYKNGAAVQVESKLKHFELRFKSEFRDFVLDSYLPWIEKRAEEIRADSKKVSINLEHPSTFETLAMEPEMKKMVIDDLDRFLRRKDFYKRVGKAWKRGYLLYRPPGTGKSSLIAAMANHLKFDIYDMDLSSIHSDSDLRRQFARTPNRSIIVIEDIDCTISLPGRNPQQFMLSGLLNLIDGLWSSCGDERIIILTTNNKDRLHQALLRPGRMDMHIHMSYLTPNGFNILVKTYLDIHGEHPRLPEIRDLIKEKNVTTAEVAEELMKIEDVDACLDGVVDFLKNKTAITTVEEKADKPKDENIKSEAREDSQHQYADVHGGWGAPLSPKKKKKEGRKKKCFLKALLNVNIKLKEFFKIDLII